VNKKGYLTAGFAALLILGIGLTTVGAGVTPLSVTPGADFKVVQSYSGDSEYVPDPANQGPPIPNAKVVIDPFDESKSDIVGYSDSEGHVHIPEAPEGWADFTVSKPGYESFRCAGKTPFTLSPIGLRKLEATADLTVVVEDSAGNRLSGAKVNVDGSNVKTTGKDGKVTFTLEADADHAITAVKENYSDELQKIHLGYQDKTITHVMTQNRVNMIVRVSDKGGNPISGATVTVSIFKERTKVTGSSGAATFTLTPGMSGSITVTKVGYERMEGSFSTPSSGSFTKEVTLVTKKYGGKFLVNGQDAKGTKRMAFQWDKINGTIAFKFVPQSPQEFAEVGRAFVRIDRSGQSPVRHKMRKSDSKYRFVWSVPKPSLTQATVSREYTAEMYYEVGTTGLKRVVGSTAIVVRRHIHEPTPTQKAKNPYTYAGAGLFIIGALGIALSRFGVP